MAEVLGLVASFIAIGQALSAVPRIIDSLKSFAETKKEIYFLINELELLRSAKDFVDDALKSVGTPGDNSVVEMSEHAFVRTVRAQIEDVMNQTAKLIADCHRGIDKSGKPRPSRLKWLWKKHRVARLSSDARQARLDLHFILTRYASAIKDTRVQALKYSTLQFEEVKQIIQRKPSNPKLSHGVNNLSESTESVTGAVAHGMDSNQSPDASVLKLRNAQTFSLESTPEFRSPASISVPLTRNISSTRGRDDRIRTSKARKSGNPLARSTHSNSGFEHRNNEIKEAQSKLAEDYIDLLLRNYFLSSNATKSEHKALIAKLEKIRPLLDPSIPFYPKIKTNTSPEGCDISCTCQCHVDYQSDSSFTTWLKSLGVGFRYQSCDITNCVQSREQSGLLNIRFLPPFWFPYQRQVELLARSPTKLQPGLGISILHSFSLKTNKVLGNDDKLWEFIRNGNIVDLRDLFVTDWDVRNSVDEDGATMLFSALVARQFEISAFLTKNFGVDERSAQLAHEILSSTHGLDKWSESELELLQQISSHGHPPQQKRYPCHSVAKGLRNIIDRPDLDNSHKSFNGRSLDELDASGKAPLHWTCQGGNISVLRLLLEAGAGVNVCTLDGDTPLMIAAHRGDLQSVRLLVEYDCELDKRNTQGRSALHFAAASPSCFGGEVIEYLLSNSAPAITRSCGAETPLHDLVSSSTAAVPMEDIRRRAKALLSGGVDINAQDIWGYSAVLQAIVENNHVALGVFLELGARLDIVDQDKQSVLHLASLYGNLSTMRSLETARIGELDIEALDYQADTPRALFQWRLSAEFSPTMPWVPPSKEEQEAFTSLLERFRVLNLTADRVRCQLAIEKIESGQYAFAVELIDYLVGKYAKWVREDEFEIFRTIKFDLLDLKIEDAKIGLKGAIVAAEGG